MQQTLLSGISPSGQLTLGNYLGAIRNWVTNQERYQCFFPLVDLHAITARQDPETFAKRCRDFVALYLACGVESNLSTVFIQSHVAEHSELAWIFQCYTQVGELKRMTQFKDKSRRNDQDINAGLFGYPVLMAADIALYRSTLVPVGEDQRQHLELTRDIIVRFNRLYGSVFPLPDAYIPETGARIMSLQDPTKKMSKSDDVAANIIRLLDSPDVIARKIRRSVTDSDGEIVVRKDKPGVSNLLHMLAAITNTSTASLEGQYHGQGYGQLKADVADAVISLIEPIQMRYSEVRSNESDLDDLLATGADQARVTARQTLSDAHKALGFVLK